MRGRDAFSIRPLRESEYGREAELVHEAYARGPYGAELEGNESWARVERDTRGRAACGEILVAVADGRARGERLLGAISVLRGGTAYTKAAGEGEVELRLAAVDPEAQGCGIGGALVRAGAELALAWGASAVRLDTGMRNPAARLYERIGFLRTPERDAEIDGGCGESVSYALSLQDRRDVRIRLLRDEEAAAVGALARDAYASSYSGLRAGYLDEVGAVAERSRSSLVWVAEELGAAAEDLGAARGSSRLLGTVTTPLPGRFLNDATAERDMDLRLLAVCSDARGRGVGTLLIEHCARLAALRGAERVVLYTADYMAAPQRLYESLGFDELLEQRRRIVREDGRAFTLLAYARAVAGNGAPDTREP